MTGLGFVKIRNAGAITVTGTGRLKARGDFVEPNGFIVQGGAITLDGTGDVTIGGVIDVSGDPAGLVRVTTPVNINIQNGSTIQGNGITSFVLDRDRFSDGGDVDIESRNGTIMLSDVINVTGTQQWQRRQRVLPGSPHDQPRRCDRCEWG
jgi:hypothetical protein